MCGHSWTQLQVSRDRQSNAAQTRYLHTVIAEKSKVSWSAKFNIGRYAYDDALAEIFFWKNNVRRLNNKYFHEYAIPSVLVCSDASNMTCGGIIAGTNIVCYCNWNDQQSKQSLTWRELFVIRFSLCSFITVLASKTVNCRSDSKTAVKILTIGSSKPELYKIALTLDNKITLLPEWVPRNLNTQADVVSKSVDFDDWRTSAFFEYLNRLWGPHTIDRFTSYKSTHLARFNCRYFVPGTEAVDAFTTTWAGRSNWLVRPILVFLG